MKSVKNPEPNHPHPISVDFFDTLPELLYIIYFVFFIVYYLKWANSSFAFGFLEHLLDQTATTVANCCHEERACCWTGASACVCRSPKDNIAESHPRVHRSIFCALLESFGQALAPPRFCNIWLIKKVTVSFSPRKILMQVLTIYGILWGLAKFCTFSTPLGDQFHILKGWRCEGEAQTDRPQAIFSPEMAWAFFSDSSSPDIG